MTRPPLTERYAAGLADLTDLREQITAHEADLSALRACEQRLLGRLDVLKELADVDANDAEAPTDDDESDETRQRDDADDNSAIPTV